MNPSVWIQWLERWKWFCRKDNARSWTRPSPIICRAMGTTRHWKHLRRRRICRGRLTGNMPDSWRRNGLLWFGCRRKWDFVFCWSIDSKEIFPTSSHVSPTSTRSMSWRGSCRRRRRNSYQELPLGRNAVPASGYQGENRTQKSNKMRLEEGGSAQFERFSKKKSSDFVGEVISIFEETKFIDYWTLTLLPGVSIISNNWFFTYKDWYLRSEFL